MVKAFLDDKYFTSFLEIIGYFGDLHGPTVTDDGVVAFRTISSPEDLFLMYKRTLIPPKKYLLQPRETMLAYSPEQGYTLTDAEPKEIVLFGIHPCDLHGISYLDRVFMEGMPDPLYAAMRRKLTLIGISCEPDEFCFCGVAGTDRPTGYDLFMDRMADGYRLAAGSTRGKKILAKLRPLLVERQSSNAHCQEYAAGRTIREAANTGETVPESPLWQVFADRCLSCGACSACCPTCYCFDVRENCGLDGKSVIRLREWDNCLFKAHGEVAGDASFRKTRLERFHYRYLHKYLGFGPLRGVASCVGCGRCREVCPVRIDLQEIVKSTFISLQ
jgi:sulfhydrogenase subunit beta (sulfur reductase)